MTTILGLIAGTLTTISFVPQVARMWRTKSTSDISLGMYLIFTTGSMMWLSYGIALRALPIILTNIVTLLLACAILALKIRYRNGA